MSALPNWSVVDDTELERLREAVQPGDTCLRRNSIAARAEEVARMIGRPELAARLHQNVALPDNPDTGAIINAYIRSGA